jgi:transposase
MPHVTGEERNQLFMISMEEMVPKDSFVRAIDSFVDAIDMKSFGFAHVQCKEEGRPSFHPAILLKLYLYGYHYGIRTSRKLEREAALNLEAMWLTSCQSPKYKTIADFRKNHAKAFRLVFLSFIRVLKEWDLVDGKTIAIDSFKIRAQNSLKNNLNQAKIDRHIAYIDYKVAEYESQLDQCDREEDQQELLAKIELQKQRKEDYQNVEHQLETTGEEQVSLTDPDSRAVVFQRNSVQVGYNVQASIDSKNKLLVEYETGDVNDSHALAQMAIAPGADR